MRAAELVEAAQISYRQLDYWTRTGRLRALQASPRSGFARSYPPSEVAVARVLAALIRFDGVEELAQMARDGFRGEVDLMPGVTVDLALLCAEADRVAA